MKTPGPILLATTNQGKIAAFRRLLWGLPFDVVTPAELGLDRSVEETGQTFEENALLKALAFSEESGLKCLADDSGLCVDALQGEPGIHSARFGGLEHAPTAQNLLLLERLETVPMAARTATFVAVIAFVSPDRPPWNVRGEVRGIIAESIRGVHGFGYDPVFVLPELGKTFAELRPEEKDPISHRGLAFQALRARLDTEPGLLE